MKVEFKSSLYEEPKPGSAWTRNLPDRLDFEGTRVQSTVRVRWINQIEGGSNMVRQEMLILKSDLVKLGELAAFLTPSTSSQSQSKETPLANQD